MNKFRRKTVPLLILLSVAFTPKAGSASQQDSRSIVLDRKGNRFEVSNLLLGGRNDLVFTAGKQRYRIKFNQIRKVELQGHSADEKKSIVVTLRDGKVLSGAIFADTNTPNTSGSIRFRVSKTLSGETKLGKFSLSLKDVRQIVFRHDESIRYCPVDQKRFVDSEFNFCPYHGDRLVTGKDLARVIVVE